MLHWLSDPDRDLLVAAWLLLGMPTVVVVVAHLTRRRWHCRRCGQRVRMVSRVPTSCGCTESPSPWEFR